MCMCFKNNILQTFLKEYLTVVFSSLNKKKNSLIKIKILIIHYFVLYAHMMTVN